MNGIQRQGDLLAIPVEKIPKNLIEKRDNILLEGEATGHYHRADAQLLVHRQNPRNDPLVLAYIDAKQLVTIKHNKHDVLELPPGLWRIQRQREWPLRLVSD